MKVASRVIILTLALCAHSITALSEPFAEKVVEQQVEKATTQKKEDIIDPAITEYAAGIKVLTPKWIQELLLKNRNSFRRISEKEKKIAEEAPLSDDEKTAIIDTLNSKNSGLYSAQVAFTLRTQREKLDITSKHELTRIYLPTSEETLSQQYREKITTTHPDTLNGYTWLTFRFVREIFDRVWIFNPKTKKPRPVAPQLRSESLFFSALSADDLYGFSGNLKNIEVTFGAPELSLVPTQKTTFETSMVGSCHVYQNKSSSTEKDNSLPPQVNLELRPTVTLSLVHQDPFNNYGKILLTIDRASKLPVYKKVEARNGDELAVSVSALALGDANSEIETAWVYGERGQTHSLLRYEQYTFCKENQFQLEPSEFDPGRLIATSS